jgi:hypothetical protein
MYSLVRRTGWIRRGFMSWPARAAEGVCRGIIDELLLAEDPFLAWTGLALAQVRHVGLVPCLLCRHEIVIRAVLPVRYQDLRCCCHLVQFGFLRASGLIGRRDQFHRPFHDQVVTGIGVHQAGVHMLLATVHQSCLDTLRERFARKCVRRPPPPQRFRALESTL